LFIFFVYTSAVAAEAATLRARRGGAHLQQEEVPKVDDEGVVESGMVDDLALHEREHLLRRTHSLPVHKLDGHHVARLLVAALLNEAEAAAVDIRYPLVSEPTAQRVPKAFVVCHST
jgi:hypothetical protein